MKLAINKKGYFFVLLIMICGICALLWGISQDDMINNIKLRGKIIEVSISDSELAKCVQPRGSNRHLKVSDEFGNTYTMLVRKSDCRLFTGNRTSAYYLSEKFCVHSSYSVSLFFRPFAYVAIVLIIMYLIYYSFNKHEDF